MTPEEFATQICLDLGIMDKEAPTQLGDWLAMRLLADRCLHLPPQKGDVKEFTYTVQDKIAPVSSPNHPDYTVKGLCTCIYAEKKYKCNPCRSAKDGHASDCWSKAHKKDAATQGDSCFCSFKPQCSICEEVGFHSQGCQCGEVKYTLPSLSKEQGRA